MRFSLLGFVAVSAACAALVACGGGGGSSSSTGITPPTMTNPTPQGKGTQVLITVYRGQHSRAHAASRRGAGARRAQYVSTNAKGLQITVTSGSVSKTVYADISLTSPLCVAPPSSSPGPTPTPAPFGKQICTLTLPTLGASETFDALETDQTPTNESASGYSTTGFSNTTNVLAAIHTTKDLTSQLGGPIQIGLSLGPVAAYFYECTQADYQLVPTPLPSPYSANFGVDDAHNNSYDIGNSTNSRIVVTAGTNATGSIQPQFCDPASGYFDYGNANPAPFVDVNTSPAPISFTSSSSAVTLVPIVNNGTPAPASSYAQTTSIASDAYYWGNLYFILSVNVSSSFTPGSTPATITMNNNLSALNPFTGQSVNQANPGNLASPGTFTYYIATISASPTTVTVPVNTTATAAVTGTDLYAGADMVAMSAYTVNDAACKNGSGTTLATIASGGSISPTTWQQTFNITAGSTAGTCTFYLADYATQVLSQPITVTVQ